MALLLVGCSDTSYDYDSLDIKVDQMERETDSRMEYLERQIKGLTHEVTGEETGCRFQEYDKCIEYNDRGGTFELGIVLNCSKTEKAQYVVCRGDTKEVDAYDTDS